MITISIDTGNAAFGDENRAWEVADILERLAQQIRDTGGAGDRGRAEMSLSESNGNQCGSVKLTGDDRWLL
jgi:hypothetical protein